MPVKIMITNGHEHLSGVAAKIIEENGLSEKLEELGRVAGVLRNEAEKSILDNIVDKEKIKELHLFYSAEEFEEFE